MSKDYYNILGVDKNANQEEIKKAFRKKAHEFHPDKQGGDEDKFKELNEAYQVLGNEKKRSQYDQFGSTFDNAQAGGSYGGYNGNPWGGSQGFNINMDDLGDMFEGFGDIFGGSRGSRRTRSQGSHVEIRIRIDFLEAVFGVEKEISLNKNVLCDKCKGNGAEPGTKIETCNTCGGSGQVTRVQRTFLGNIQTQTTCSDCEGEGKIYAKKCTKCHGNGVVNDTVKIKVKIPAGIDNGEVIKLSGHGEVGLRGAPVGDLFLHVMVEENKRFKREAYDIKSEVNISFSQAILGDKIEIETVDGIVKLKIPEGTQSGTTFRLKDHGVPKLRGKGRGDHFVKVDIITPRNLNKKQKKIIEDLGL